MLVNNRVQTNMLLAIANRLKYRRELMLYKLAKLNFSKKHIVVCNSFISLFLN